MRYIWNWMCLSVVHFVIWIFESHWQFPEPKNTEWSNAWLSGLCAFSNCKSLNFIIWVREIRTQTHKQWDIPLLYSVDLSRLAANSKKIGKFTKTDKRIFSLRKCDFKRNRSHSVEVDTELSFRYFNRALRYMVNKNKGKQEQQHQNRRMCLKTHWERATLSWIYIQFDLV